MQRIPMLIVADAGPLIALAVGGVLPASVNMLGGLLVPEPVLQECTADPSAPGAAIIHEVHASGGFQIIPQASLAPLDAAFAQGLGTGEIAVLSYAATHALLALIDERRARAVAQRLQVAVIGSGALLVQLKRQGLIDSVQAVLEVWKRHGYFVSHAVQNDVLLRAGEGQPGPENEI
jgi:predicted nucleic acid-binding protein